MTPEQQQEFATLFRDYVAQTYAEKLASFGGAPFRVTGTRQNGDETIVTSQIARQSGPAELQWHVADRGGRFVVTDVQVNGASMRVSERDQLASIMQRNGGRPDALLSVMRQQTAHTGAPQRPGAMPPGGAVGSSQPPRQ
jgi:phospholipid transport system substrate-binding protein